MILRRTTDPGWLPLALSRFDEVLIDRLYSHPVSADVQRMKFFALESMHDLRSTPSRQYQLIAGDDRAIEPEKAGPVMDVSYLRRGPKSNEFFYAYDQDSVKPMIESFLKAWKARSGS